MTPLCSWGPSKFMDPYPKKAALVFEYLVTQLYNVTKINIKILETRYKYEYYGVCVLNYLSLEV